MPDDTKDLRAKLWDLAIKVGFVAFPILFGWVIKLEVNNAVYAQRIKVLETDVAAGKAVGKDITDIKVAVGSLDTRVTGMGAKVDLIYSKLLE